MGVEPEPFLLLVQHRDGIVGPCVIGDEGASLTLDMSFEGRVVGAADADKNGCCVFGIHAVSNLKQSLSSIY